MPHVNNQSLGVIRVPGQTGCVVQIIKWNRIIEIITNVKGQGWRVLPVQRLQSSPSLPTALASG